MFVILHAFINRQNLYMHKTTLFLFILFLIFGNNLFAQAPKYSNDFLNIGIGARNLAMGGAVTSTVKDVTAAYWNPAGLTTDEADLQVGLMHAEYFAGVANYDYGAIKYKIDKNNALALSFIRLGIDNIPNTLNLFDASGAINYNNISEFSATDNAFMLSYARQSNTAWRMGANAKIIRRTIGPFGGAWGFGLDFGVQKSFKGWEFSLMARDVTSTFNAWSFNTNEFKDIFAATGNVIPVNSVEVTLPTFIAGVGKKIEFNDDWQLITEANFAITTDGRRNTLIKTNFASIDPRLGFEVGYKDLIFVRGGINNIQQQRNIDNQTNTTIQPNLGIGAKIKQVRLDYALTNVGAGGSSLYSNIISLVFDINKRD